MTPNIEDSPAVLAYRMGQVEIAVKESGIAVVEGFKAHDKKLDSLTSSFASKDDLAVIQRQLDNYKWFFRALVVATLTALAGVVIALFTKV